MSSEIEAKFMKEIEREVQELLEKRRYHEKAMPEKVYYFKIMDEGDLEDLLEKVREKKIVLISLDKIDPSRIRDIVLEVKRGVDESDGRIYLIRWPLLLILPRGMELMTHS